MRQEFNLLWIILVPCAATQKLNLNRLQRVQNYAAHIINKSVDYINTRTIDLLRSLRWTNVEERGDYFIAVFMFMLCLMLFMD